MQNQGMSPSAVGESASYIVKNLLQLGKNCTGVVTNCNVKSGRCRMINDCLEMASEKTDPKRLRCPVDTNEYITLNYLTNMLKYIPHVQCTNIQKS